MVNHYPVRKGGLDTAAKVVISLYPQDFLKFVKDHSLTDVYMVDKDDPFVVGKNIVMKSKCGYFFAATCDNVICFLDPMGYRDLESLDESLENNSFYAINEIKNENHSEYWSNDTGTIYRRLSGNGYDDEAKIKRAYRFLEGNIGILTYDEFVKCEGKAKEGGFRTLSELCVSRAAGFKNKADYDDAKELKAPDAQSLEAHRLLEEIQLELDYDSISESLLAGVIMHLATEKRGIGKGEVFIDLNKIYYLYRYWQPEKHMDELNRFKKEEEVEAFLQSSKGRLLGYYSPSQRKAIRFFSTFQAYFHNRRTYSWRRKDTIQNIYTWIGSTSHSSFQESDISR